MRVISSLQDQCSSASRAFGAMFSFFPRKYLTKLNSSSVLLVVQRVEFRKMPNSVEKNMHPQSRRRNSTWPWKNLLKLRNILTSKSAPPQLITLITDCNGTFSTHLAYDLLRTMGPNDWFQWLSGNASNKSTLDCAYESMLTTFVYYIWAARNDAIFNNLIPSVQCCAGRIKSQVIAGIVAKCDRTNPSVAQLLSSLRHHG
ncbi:hypothetical protein V2J09_001232 [Rumex salicifolius]